jgi:hypothetical protein
VAMKPNMNPIAAPSPIAAVLIAMTTVDDAGARAGWTGATIPPVVTRASAMAPTS